MLNFCEDVNPLRAEITRDRVRNRHGGKLLVKRSAAGTEAEPGAYDGLLPRRPGCFVSVPTRIDAVGYRVDMQIAVSPYLRTVETSLRKLADRPVLIVWDIKNFAFREAQLKWFERVFFRHTRP